MSGLADRRRNLGPTDAVPFQIASAPKNEPLKDGPRPVFIRQGVTALATGSAYLESGQTKIQCSVHGPIQLRTGDKFHPKAQVSVEVNVEPYSGAAGSTEEAEDLERTLADFVRASLTPAIYLDQYPKSAITISLEVLSAADGAGRAPQLAAAVNAATLALVNAGIALRDMVTAVAVAVADNKILADVDVDASCQQLVAAYSNGASLSSTSQTTVPPQLVSLMVTAEGEVERKTLRELLAKAESAARELRLLFNGYLVEDYAARAN